MSEAKTRAKYGYLSYNDMLTRISEGILDEYDIVFTTDTKECYVITPELIPSPIRSKVYVYSSVSEAESAINNNVDTYIGQIVSVWHKDAYRGYIVNTSKTRDGALYSLTPLSELTEELDYNILGNRPIINMVGTLDEPIILTELSDGFYSIKGQYQITENDETIYLGASYILFSIEHNGSARYIKKISSHEIIDYTIENDTISSSSMITQEYLETKGYVTQTYVDNKLAALDVLTTEEIKKYIDDMLAETLGEKVEEIVDKKIDEKIQVVAEGEITTLFI